MPGLQQRSLRSISAAKPEQRSSRSISAVKPNMPGRSARPRARSSSVVNLPSAARDLALQIQNNLCDQLFDRGLKEEQVTAALKMAKSSAKMWSDTSVMGADPRQVPSLDRDSFERVAKELGGAHEDLGESFINRLFDSFDLSSHGIIEMREFFFALAAHLAKHDVIQMLKLVFNLYCEGDKDTLPGEDVREALKVALSRGTNFDPATIQILCVDVFRNMDVSNESIFTFERFHDLVKSSKTIRESFKM